MGNLSTFAEGGQGARRAGPRSKFYNLPREIREQILDERFTPIMVHRWLLTEPEDGGPEGGPYAWVNYNNVRDWRRYNYSVDE